jgi:hypothetical protein
MFHQFVHWYDRYMFLDKEFGRRLLQLAQLQFLLGLLQMFDFLAGRLSHRHRRRIHHRKMIV